jgi:hypothetical protein
MPFSSTLPYYRTTGPWGVGLGMDLVNSYVDVDFYTLIQNDNYLLALINGFITVPPTSIADFIVSGNQFYVELTNHTMLGPYTLPSAIWTVVPGGTWQPNTAYVVNDVFTTNGTVYLVIFPYPGAPTFDPGANDGHGHNYFQPILTVPGNVLPTGGTVGQVLGKHSSADFDVMWETLYLSGLADVTFTSLSVGQIPSWNGSRWVNKSVGSLGLTIEDLSDVLVLSPHDAGDVWQFNGTDTVNVPLANLGLTFPDISGTIQLGQSQLPVVPLTPTTGAVPVDPTLANVFTLAQSGNVTLGALSAPAGSWITIIIISNGASNTVTPSSGGNFRSAGALNTGASSGMIYTLSFVGDGTNMNETGRTGPLS